MREHANWPAMVSLVNDHVAQQFRADRPGAGSAVPAKLLHAVSITSERSDKPARGRPAAACNPSG